MKTYPTPIRLDQALYTFKNPDGTLWSDLYGKKYIFKKTFPFSEGYARVWFEDDTFAFIDENRKYLKQPLFVKFFNARDFHEGYAAVQLKDKSYTFIDKHGNMFKQRYYRAYDFNEGFAVIQLGKGKYTFVDRDGTMMKNRFADAWNFHEGFASVKMYKEYDKRTQKKPDYDYFMTYVNTDGVYLDYDFKQVCTFNKGLAQVLTFDDKIMYLDRYWALWEKEKGEQLKKIYAEPKLIMQIGNEEKDFPFFKIALSIVKQKITDMKNSDVDKDEIKDLVQTLDEQIKQKFPDFLYQLKKQRKYGQDEDMLIK